MRSTASRIRTVSTASQYTSLDDEQRSHSSIRRHYGDVFERDATLRASRSFGLDAIPRHYLPNLLVELRSLFAGSRHGEQGAEIERLTSTVFLSDFDGDSAVGGHIVLDTRDRSDDGHLARFRRVASRVALATGETHVHGHNG